MEDLLLYLLKNIVDHDDAVEVNQENIDEIIRFQIKVHQDDYPKIIGKNGQTIKAITEIIRVYDSKKNPGSTHRIFVNAEA